MECKHESRIGKCSNCDSNGNCLFDKCQSQLEYITNADRIRNMTDKELAEKMVFYQGNCWWTNLFDGHWTDERYAIKAVIEWLRKEVEE